MPLTGLMRDTLIPFLPTLAPGTCKGSSAFTGLYQVWSKELELGFLILLHSPLQRRSTPSFCPRKEDVLGQRAEGPKKLELACSPLVGGGVSTCWLTPSKIRPLILPWAGPPLSLFGFWQELPNWSLHFCLCFLYGLFSTESQRDPHDRIMYPVLAPTMASLHIFFFKKTGV